MCLMLGLILVKILESEREDEKCDAKGTAKLHAPLYTHIGLWYLFGDSYLSNNLIKTIEDEIFKINLFFSSYSFNFL